MSRSDSANVASMFAIARPCGVEKSTPRSSGSSPASGQVDDRAGVLDRPREPIDLRHHELIGPNPEFFLTGRLPR